MCRSLFSVMIALFCQGDGPGALPTNVPVLLACFTQAQQSRGMVHAQARPFMPEGKTKQDAIREKTTTGPPPHPSRFQGSDLRAIPGRDLGLHTPACLPAPLRWTARARAASWLDAAPFVQDVSDQPENTSRRHSYKRTGERERKKQRRRASIAMIPILPSPVGPSLCANPRGKQTSRAELSRQAG